MILKHELARKWGIGVERHRSDPVEILLAEARMAAAASALLRRSKSNVASFVTASFSLARPAFILWTVSQVKSVSLPLMAMNIRLSLNAVKMVLYVGFWLG